MSNRPADPISEKIDRHESAAQLPGHHSLQMEPKVAIPFPACLRYDAFPVS